MDTRFVDQARRDLASLLAAHPELEQDDILRLDMVEAETNALDLLDQLIGVEAESVAMESACVLLLERIQKRKERFVNRRAAVRKYIMQIMEAANLRKVERPAATVSIAAGRPKVVIVDESELPERCVRIRREPNRELIAAAIKNGETVPGATLSNPEPVLRIS